MKNNRKYFIAVSVIFIAVFGVMTFHELETNDFVGHINWAKEFSQYGYMEYNPRSLFPRIVTIVRALLPANFLVWICPWIKQVYDIKSFEISALIVIVAAYLASGWIVLHRLIKNSNGNSQIWKWVSAGATLSLFLVGPISIFTAPDRMYLGYITANPFHSSTYILLRPFALLLFFSIADGWFEKWTWKKTFMVSLFTICATLAKPSFTLTVLPSIGILFIVYIKKWKEINWKLLVVSLGLIGVLILGSQYWLKYAGHSDERILFLPFVAILTYVPNIPTVLFFSFVSILFPVAVAVSYWKELKSSLIYQLAWVNFLVSLVLAYFFAEATIIAALNFWWGPMIALFILFYLSIEFWFRHITQIQSFTTIIKRDAIIATTLFLHLVFGVWYYVEVLLYRGFYLVG